jgi:hypothetical protein
MTSLLLKLEHLRRRSRLASPGTKLGGVVVAARHANFTAAFSIDTQSPEVTFSTVQRKRSWANTLSMRESVIERPESPSCLGTVALIAGRPVRWSRL